MAVRPPGGDDSSEPENVAFGIAALNARIDEAEVSFPATSEELLAALDSPDIPCDASGSTMPLAEALAAVPEDRFETETELLDALHPVFEERRVEGGNGVFAKLKRLLPF